MKRSTLIPIGVLLFCIGVVFSFDPGSARAQNSLLLSESAGSHNLVGVGEGADCGEKVRPAEFYESLSLYSLIAGFGLFFCGIFLEKKPLKLSLWGFALAPLGIWVYANFFVDYAHLNKTLFNYNVAAESALANIAEGQERYKDEMGFYLKDLNKLYSHLAGAHGVDPCVKILELKVAGNDWSATASHVYSSGKVTWKGKSGSSLKKG